MLLHTPRLTLRDLDPYHDAPALFELNTDPEVVRYTGDGPFDSLEAARTFFINRRAVYDRDGMGRWSVVRRPDGEFLGWCGLRLEDNGDVDLGYRFFRRHWGQGYATEAARACLTHGFSTLRLPRIMARIDPANHASLNVARKLGMRPLPGLHDGHGTQAQIFELTAPEWAG